MANAANVHGVVTPVMYFHIFAPYLAVVGLSSGSLFFGRVFRIVRQRIMCRHDFDIPL
jgi:hypothetical protein